MQGGNLILYFLCESASFLCGKDKEIKKVSQLVPDKEEIDIKSSYVKGNSHGGSNNREKKEEEEENKRDSQVDSEILGGIYIYH